MRLKHKGGTLLVTIADVHINSTTGLNPPEIRLDDGQVVLLSEAQKRDLWEPWLECQQYVRERAKKLGARVVVLFNGDGPDLLRYCQHQLVTVNRSVVVQTAVEVLSGWREMADVFLVNRGTQAHSGGSGELEELMARELDATKCPHSGNYSWWWIQATFDGVRVEAGHRPISNSTRVHLRGAGARRTAADRSAAYLRMGDAVPHLGIFSHVHHWADSGENYPERVVFTHPWQLCTAYGYNVGFGGNQDPQGVWLFHCKDEVYSMERWEHKPKVLPFYEL